MKTHRLPIVSFALLALAAAPAHAQRWGGGGIGASASSTNLANHVSHRRIAWNGPLIFVPAPVLVLDATPERRASGGAWNGRQPVWGGSPPSIAPARQRFVAPQPVVVAPVAANAVAAGDPATNRRLGYLQRYGRP